MMNLKLILIFKLLSFYYHIELLPFVYHLTAPILHSHLMLVFFLLLVLPTNRKSHEGDKLLKKKLSLIFLLLQERKAVQLKMPILVFASVV